ncbi:Uncharacterised protein [Mycobacteroides abscessus subsp. abscessus]|nr:Uncharacterised protein [Mycobacteroides abscessus subsp. abscessus]
MIANALGPAHHGQTLVHGKRRYRIDQVEHNTSFVLVIGTTSRGRERLPLPLDATVQVEP